MAISGVCFAMQSPLRADQSLNFDTEAVRHKASGAVGSRSTSAGSASSLPASRRFRGDCFGTLGHDGTAHKVHVATPGAILATPGSPSSPVSSEERFASWSYPSSSRSPHYDCLMGLGALAEAVGNAVLPSDVEEDQELMEYGARYAMRGGIPPPPPLPPVLATFAPTVQPPMPPPHLSASQVYQHMQGNIGVWPRSTEKSPQTFGSIGHSDGNCTPYAFVNRGDGPSAAAAAAAGEMGRRQQQHHHRVTASFHYKH